MYNSVLKRLAGLPWGVQWLRFSTFSAVTQVQSLVRARPSHKQKKKTSLPVDVCHVRAAVSVCFFKAPCYFSLPSECCFLSKSPRWAARKFKVLCSWEIIWNSCCRTCSRNIFEGSIRFMGCRNPTGSLGGENVVWFRIFSAPLSTPQTVRGAARPRPPTFGARPPAPPRGPRRAPPGIRRARGRPLRTVFVSRPRAALCCSEVRIAATRPGNCDSLPSTGFREKT